jgi:hypothetical protein
MSKPTAAIGGNRQGQIKAILESWSIEETRQLIEEMETEIIRTAN